jgi:hypothetical protein
LARGLITGDADLAAPALRQEVFQYIFNTLRPNGADGKNYMVEYSDLVHAYLPSGSNAFQATSQIAVDAYLGTRVFGLRSSPKTDDFGVNWRTWTKNGKLLVGDNLYLADTLIDEFVTEKKWTGGDLALAYEWDDGVEVWINGLNAQDDWADFSSNAATATKNIIKRGNKTDYLPVVGLKVQLFDNGEIYETRNTANQLVPVWDVDNGAVGKVVITYEYLAQVTKYDATTKTVDFEVFDEVTNTSTSAIPFDVANKVNGRVKFSEIPVDDTFALRDFIVVIPQAGLTQQRNAAGTPASLEGKEFVNDSYFNGTSTNALTGVYEFLGYDRKYISTAFVAGDDNDTNTYDLSIGTASILSVKKAESVQTTVSSFTRQNISTAETWLATVKTGDATYNVNTWYRFGRGQTPGFDAETLFYLDSNGFVIGVSGDTISKATLDYLYVTQLYASNNNFNIPRVQARATLGKSNTESVYDLPVKKTTSGAYVFTINDREVAVPSMADSAAFNDGGYATYIGWYSYKATDAGVVTLKNNQTTGVGATATPIATTATGDYKVGSIVEGTFVRTAGINFTGDNIPNTFTSSGGILADSKTKIYSLGGTYTGYASYPVGHKSGAPDPVWAPGKALAVYDNSGSGVVAAVFVVGTPVTVRTTGYAVIKSLPYQGSTYRPGSVNYEVAGSNANITYAYELDATYSSFSYNIGDIVDVELVDGEYKIIDKRDYKPGAYGTPLYTTVSVTDVHYTKEYFTTSHATTLAQVTPTAATIIFDQYAAQHSGSGVEKQDFPKKGDVVVIGQGETGTEAVIIVAHAGEEAVVYAVESAFGANYTVTTDATGKITAFPTAWATAASAGITDIYKSGTTSDATWKLDAAAQIEKFLNTVPGQTLTVVITSDEATVGSGGAITGTATVTATTSYSYALGNTIVNIPMNLSITGVGFTTTLPAYSTPKELSDINVHVLGVVAGGSVPAGNDSNLNPYFTATENGVYIYGLFAGQSVPVSITGYSRVNTFTELTATSSNWMTLVVSGFTYVLVNP